MAFQPGGIIGQQSEAGGVRLGEAVFTKALNLTKYLFGKCFVVTPCQHTVN